jgi:hypothetical protein
MPLRSSFTTTPGGAVTIPPESITGGQIASGAVGTSELGPDAVTTDKIAPGAVGTTDLADLSVTGAKLADGSIPWSKITPQSVPAAALEHPIGVTDVDVTGAIAGSKITPPTDQIVQFNGTPLPAAAYLNFLGSLVDVAHEAAADRVNVNLTGIETSQPPKGTDGQVKAIGGEAGNTIGAAQSWAGSDHGHALKAVPISGLYGDLAALPFASAPGAAADAVVSRTGPDALRLPKVVGVAVAPQAFGAQHGALRVGGYGAVWSDLSHGGVPTFIGSNVYSDGTTYRAIETGPGRLVTLNGDPTLSVTVQTAPAATQGQPLAFTTRLQVSQAGSLTVAPDAGQAHVAAASGNLLLSAPSFVDLAALGAARLQIQHGQGVPLSDGGYQWGGPSNRFSVFYASNGVIQTCDPAEKFGVRAVEPGAALADVLGATMIEYDLPCPTADDPGATMHHVGFDATAAAPRLRVTRTAGGSSVTSAEVEPNTTASMALGAIQGLHGLIVVLSEQVAALTTRVAALDGA